MKHKGLIFSTLIIFSLSLYLAYYQVTLYYAQAAPIKESTLQISGATQSLSGLGAEAVNLFGTFLSAITNTFAGSLMAAIIVLALLVEFITLYPAVKIQLKQKKIHLFHRKLVDRFKSGELTMTKTKRELDILYSVNETLHKKGALLVVFQLAVFITVLAGLYFISFHPEAYTSSFNALNYALMAKPLTANLPLLAALAYLLHSLIKIALKQKEDYISQTQINIALAFGVLGSVAVFFFSGIFSTLLSIYLLTQITFASMRYLIVEENSMKWGKVAQKELIKMLRDTPTAKNKFERFSQQFNHLAPVRHLNFHLLEEGLSMSFVFAIALHGLQIL